MVLAGLCYNEGRKKDAVKLFVKAMDEEDSNELIQSLDDLNAENDPFAEEAPEAEGEEVLSDEEIDEILNEPEADEAEEVDEAEEEVALPEDIESVVAKVMARKVAIANKKSLSGSRESRKAALSALKRR